MTLRFQFAGWLLIPLMAAALAIPSAAQRPHEQDRPPKAQQPQVRREQRRQERQQQKAPQPAGIPHSQANRPPNARTYTPPPPRNAEATRPPQTWAGNPANGTTRPRTLTPEERQRMEQNRKRFNQLPPQQKQELRERAQVWQKMTEEQRQHIRNDVLPKWKELPPDRKRAIQQRLGVLQNMPESARNRHLNDPNFTRGMNEEDRATLHDLSHLHVGGAPEPPNE
jgi:hypothetical protein